MDKFERSENGTFSNDTRANSTSAPTRNRIRRDVRVVNYPYHLAAAAELDTSGNTLHRNKYKSQL